MIAIGGRRTRFVVELSTVLFATLVVLSAVDPGAAFGQRRSTREERPAAPVDDELTTKDGLRLTCRYYPGPASKNTVPVIMIHGWKGQGSEFEPFAQFLQSPAGGGCAVILPDLRGHGGSLHITPPGSLREEELSADRMRRNDLYAIVRFDLESVKKYLLERHNEEQLNIDALTVVGAEMGALVALHWTAQDWNWPPLAGIKQGQDVKALVLLSPPQAFKGVTAQVALTQPDLRDRVSVLLLCGEQEQKSAASVRRIHGTLRRNRIEDFATPEEEKDKKDLFLLGLDTSLQGTKLLTGGQLSTERVIAQFIDARVRSRMEAEFPWKSRRSPLE